MSSQQSELVKAGVHSVEGTTGGARAVALARERGAQRSVIERQRAEIVARNKGELPSFARESTTQQHKPPSKPKVAAKVNASDLS